MTIPRKVKIGLVVVGVFALIGLWQWLSFVFKTGYSKGSRTGIVRKVSVKGPPYCKYLEGEMALQGGAAGMVQEIFRFTVDDQSESNPVVQALKKAERDGKPVTLEYRQDKDIWWRCNDGGKPVGAASEPELTESHYYIVNVQP